MPPSLPFLHRVVGRQPPSHHTVSMDGCPATPLGALEQYAVVGQAGEDAPIAGPTIQTQKLSNVPDTSAGPNQRAGLSAAPETAPTASTLMLIVRPIGQAGEDAERAALVDGDAVDDEDEEERGHDLGHERVARAEAVPADRGHAEVDASVIADGKIASSTSAAAVAPASWLTQ